MKLPQRLWRLVSSSVRTSVFRIPAGERAIIFDIQVMKSLRPYRRLLATFELAGFTVYIQSGFNRRTVQVTGDLKWHANTRLIWHKPAPSERLILCTDQPDTAQNRKYQKCIRLEYDYGPNLPLPDESHFAAPFTMHPQIYGQYQDHKRLEEFRSQPRTLKMLFAGNADPDYDNTSICEVCGLVGRHTIIEHLKQQSVIETLTPPTPFSPDNLGDYPNKLVLLDGVRIHQQDWMKTMAAADFFLSAPGILYPLTHNAIEAMAVGTIPILNYPDWYFPNLEDGKNCIAFTSLDELDAKIEHIQTMKPSELAALRQGVIQYYTDHLDPVGFVERILNSPQQTVTLHVMDLSEEAVRRAMAH